MEVFKQRKKAFLLLGLGGFVLAGAAVFILGPRMMDQVPMETAAPTPAPPPPPPTTTAESLLSSDPAVRKDASDILLKMSPEAKKKLVPDLAAALKLKEPESRRSAVEALGAIGPEAQAALPELLQALKDDETQRLAAQALARVGIGPQVKDAVPALVKILRGSDGPIVRKVADKNGNRVTVTTNRDGLRESAARALRDPAAAAAIPDLRDVLKKDKDPKVRIAAAYALGAMQAQAAQAVPALIDALKDKTPEVRAEAAAQLGQLHAASKETISSLKPLLKDQSADVRGVAERVLGGMNTVEAGAALAAKKDLPVIDVGQEQRLEEPEQSKENVVELLDKFCLNEIGIFCNSVKDDPARSVRCLRKNQENLLEACAKQLETLRFAR